MKSTLIILIFSFFGIQTTFAQSKSEVYAQAEKVWLGIDFSQTSFVDPLAFPNPAVLPGLMYAWNTFVEREADKYDLNKAFKSKVSIDLTQTNASYEKIDNSKIVKTSCTTLSQEDAEKIALSYDFSETKGMAILMVADCFNKNVNAGTYWLVVVNTQDKSIFYSKKYSGKPGGFGVKNYWAKSFYNVLQDVESSLRSDLKK